MSFAQRMDSSDMIGLEQLNLRPGSSRVLIVGLGVTGLSVVRFLAARNISFAIVDSREQPAGLTELRENFPDAAVFLGGFNAAAFEVATHLVVSPGVSLAEPAIAAAAARNIPILGDLDLFACEATAPVIGITGSNGKSTVTTLVGMMAEAAGRKVRVGGNLGTPMLDLLDPSANLYVLELSSFQLERTCLFHATVATVLNISPDHMDRYPSLEAYAASKQRVFEGSGRMILNRDDPVVAAMTAPKRDCRWFSLEPGCADYGLGLVDGEEWLCVAGVAVMPAAEVRIQGRHNLANALAALALGDAVGLPRPAMADALRRFAGLDHRMQWVAEIDGVTWINDSKATNVGACAAALAGLSCPAILIAGGDGKGADFRVLRSVVAEKVRAAVLMGRDAPLLEEALKDLVPTVRVENMRQAVLAAQGLAQKGDAVLLAPACASLDQYKDYQERGRMFADVVRSLQP